MAVNNITVSGRLAKELELRYTQSGKAVGNTTIAVDRKYARDETDFFNVVIWGKSAEILANFTTKGSPVAFEGRLQSRSYENKQGQNVTLVEIVANDFTLFENREQTEQRRKGGNNNQTQQPQSNPFGTGTEIDIQDSDLPF